MITRISENKPTALNDWTYQLIKERILLLELEPGQQLNIEEFVEKLEVSRTPIREAFLRLEAEGLVEVKPRVGYFVVDITEKDILDLFEVREIIETWSAKKSAHLLTEKELDEIESLLIESELAVQNQDMVKFMENEILFHKYLQKHIKNRHLLEFMGELNDLTYRERMFSLKSTENVEQTLTEHRHILEALKKRDGQGAEWLMGEHIHNVCVRLVELIKQCN